MLFNIIGTSIFGVGSYIFYNKLYLEHARIKKEKLALQNSITCYSKCKEIHEKKPTILKMAIQNNKYISICEQFISHYTTHVNFDNRTKINNIYTVPTIQNRLFFQTFEDPHFLNVTKDNIPMMRSDTAINMIPCKMTFTCNGHKLQQYLQLNYNISLGLNVNSLYIANEKNLDNCLLYFYGQLIEGKFVYDIVSTNSTKIIDTVVSDDNTQTLTCGLILSSVCFIGGLISFMNNK